MGAGAVVAGFYRRGMWRYRLKDWHEGLGISHEQWWQNLLAEGYEPEMPELEPGAEFVLDGRTIRRHAVRIWIPTPSEPEPPERR